VSRRHPRHTDGPGRERERIVVGRGAVQPDADGTPSGGAPEHAVSEFVNHGFTAGSDRDLLVRPHQFNIRILKFGSDGTGPLAVVVVNVR